MITIRNETPADYRAVEELIRRSFWNQYVPGCHEHYLAHIIRPHRDFLPELDLVLELDGEIIASVMYTRARLVDESGEEKSILTFGPFCTAPEYQRQGYGKRLLEESLARAELLGGEAVVIFGSPANYVSRGFQSCKKYQVSLEGGTYPAAMLVKELKPGVLAGRKWTYVQSPAFDFDEGEAEAFDRQFEPMEKGWQPSQEEFYILSNAALP